MMMVDRNCACIRVTTEIDKVQEGDEKIFRRMFEIVGSMIFVENVDRVIVINESNVIN